MTWRDDLMEALRNKDAEELKRIAHQARMRYEPTIKPKFDYKQIEAEGREPGADDD